MVCFVMFLTLTLSYNVLICNILKQRSLIKDSNQILIVLLFFFLQMLAILIKFCKNSNFAPSVPTNLLQFCKHSSSTKKFITLISNLFKILFETISSQFETTTSIWPFKRFWMYSNHFRSFRIFWKF